MRRDRKPETGERACATAMDGRPLGQFVLCKLSEAKTVPQSSLPSMVPRDSWPGERPPMTQGWGS